MNLFTKKNLKIYFANFFGALGYLSCTLQWLWLFVLYSSLLKSLVKFVNTNETVVKPVTHVASHSNILLAIISGIIVVAALVATIYFIYKIPSTIIKTGRKTVQKSAEAAAPIVLKVQHKKETKRNLIKLTPTISLIIKALLIIVPLIVALFSNSIREQAIDYYIAVLVSVWVAGSSITTFAAQYLSARFMKISLNDLW